MEIQISSAGSEFELEDNGHEKKQKVRFYPVLLWQVKHFCDKRKFAFKTIPNVCGMKGAVVWALSINAIGILMAFVHFDIMTLLTFVDV